MKMLSDVNGVFGVKFEGDTTLDQVVAVIQGGSDGSVEVFNPGDGAMYTLEEMQAAVGGYVETVNIPPDMILLVDEDGRFKTDLSPNRAASALCGQAIVGPACLVPRGSI